MDYIKELDKMNNEKFYEKAYWEIDEKYKKSQDSANKWMDKYYDLIYAIDRSIHSKERKEHIKYKYLDYGVKEDGSIGVLDTDLNRKRISG